MKAWDQQLGPVRLSAIRVRGRDSLESSARVPRSAASEIDVNTVPDSIYGKLYSLSKIFI